MVIGSILSSVIFTWLESTAFYLHGLFIKFTSEMRIRLNKN